MYFEVLPLWYQYSVVIVLGLIVGSFLNVVIYRLHTGRSLNGHSHCMSCGKSLTWYELIPLVSYMIQKGRCRGCSSYVPLRYLLCELLTACLFLQVFFYTAEPFALVLTLFLVSLLVVTFFYDYYHLIIPDILVLLITIVCVGILLQQSYDWQWLGTHLFGAVSAFAFFAGLWLVSKGRWIGLGDAKLAFPLALILGPMGTFSFIILSFWIGAIVSLSLLGGVMLLKRGQRYLPISRKHFTMKSEVPFAPFIIVSFLMVYLYGIDVLEVLQHVLMPI